MMFDPVTKWLIVACFVLMCAILLLESLSTL
jgi:hypothetical protein